MKLHDVRFLFTEIQRPIGFDLPHEDKLSDFDNRFQLILRKHLTILAWWSILNCVEGFIAILILFTVLGLFPSVLVYFLLKKTNSTFAEYFNFFKDMHWAWPFSIYVAFALIIWIQVETIYV